jgi:hypothetical protein
MLGALFCAIVLVAAVKGFGAAGHPTWGLVIGITVLVVSFLLYLRQARLKGNDGGPERRRSRSRD